MDTHTPRPRRSRLIFRVAAIFAIAAIVPAASAQFVPPAEERPARSAPVRPDQPRQAPAAEKRPAISAEPVFDEPVIPIDTASLRDWVQYAYLVANPLDAPEAMALAEQEGMLTTETMRVFGVHLAALATAEHRKFGPPADVVLDSWLGDALRAPSPAARGALLGALWWAADGPSERLAQAVEALPLDAEQEAVFWARLMSTPSPKVTELDTNSPAVIDLWWAAFAGSGDLETMEALFRRLPGPGEAAQPDDPELAAQSRQTALSLIAYGHQHPRVLRMLRGRRAEVQGDWGVLDQVLLSIDTTLRETPAPLPKPEVYER
ncbi:MAG: hypothetical protein AAF235_05775 [Planctomycetota bacterium]